MAKVTYSAGIDSVSGALSKPSKSGQHSCSKMLLYLRNKVERSTPLTSNELDARARFAAVAAAVKARKSDLNKITTDQINFAAQKDQAGGKKTMKAYLWKICGEAYDAEHNG